MIVSVRGDALSQERKLLYTAEFRCPTLFLHDALPGQHRRVEIYDPVRGEIPFGGTQLLGLCLHVCEIWFEDNTRPFPSDLLQKRH